LPIKNRIIGWPRPKSGRGLDYPAISEEHHGLAQASQCTPPRSKVDGSLRLPRLTNFPPFLCFFAGLAFFAYRGANVARTINFGSGSGNCGGAAGIAGIRTELCDSSFHFWSPRVSFLSGLVFRAAFLHRHQHSPALLLQEQLCPNVSETEIADRISNLTS